jgi:hypothetical protein
VSPWLLDNPLIDGFGPDDTLHLTFSEPVTLLNAAFSWVDSRDAFSLYIDGESVLEADIPDGNVFNFLGELSPAELTGTVFGFSVTDWDDDYFLVGHEVLFPAVPIPGAVWMFASGLIGLVANRRKLRR